MLCHICTHVHSHVFHPRTAARFRPCVKVKKGLDWPSSVFIDSTSVYCRIQFRVFVLHIYFLYRICFS